MEVETKNENGGFDPIKVTEMLNDFANGDAAAFQQDMEAVACIVNDTYKHLCEYDFYKSLLKAICSLSAAGDKDGAEALADGALTLFSLNGYAPDMVRIGDMLEKIAES